MNLEMAGRISILAILVLVAGLLTWRAARSRILPHRIPFEAWKLTFTAVPLGKPLLVLLIALVIGAGAGLQSLFMFFLHPGQLQAQLPAISLGWQAVMALVTAGLVAPIQMFVLQHALYPPPGFSFPRGVLRTALYAAGVGLLIWCLNFGLILGAQAVVQAGPPIARQGLALGLPLIIFLIGNLLALIRPALALGARNPFTTGVRLAARTLLPLTLMQVMLLIPPAIMIPICVHAPKLVFGPQDNTQPITIVAGTVFTIFQFLAVEVATTIFTRRADFVRHTLKPGEAPPPIFAP